MQTKSKLLQFASPEKKLKGRRKREVLTRTVQESYTFAQWTVQHNSHNIQILVYRNPNLPVIPANPNPSPNPNPDPNPTFRSTKKPFKLRMNPTPNPGERTTDKERIAYLRVVLLLMMNENATRPLHPTLGTATTNLVRTLPVVAEVFVNPLVVRLKGEQEALVQAMASPKDNLWLMKLQQEFIGEVLYDGGYYRVFAVQYVPNKTSNRYTCWEATTKPVYEDDDGHFVVHERHFAIGPEGSRTLLKSLMIEFALAEYSNGIFPQTLTLTLNLTLTLTVWRKKINIFSYI
jgi:hypothetical protein